MVPGPLRVPLVPAAVVHLSLEVDDGRGFANVYCEPASSHSVTELDDNVTVEAAPKKSPVIVGGVGEPPPWMVYATPRGY